MDRSKETGTPSEWRQHSSDLTSDSLSSTSTSTKISGNSSVDIEQHVKNLTVSDDSLNKRGIHQTKVSTDLQVECNKLSPDQEMTTDSCSTSGDSDNKAGELILDKVICIDDFEKEARRKLNKTIYDYYAGGSDNEVTLKWNKTMISQRFCLKPRILCNVSKVDLTKYIYGDKISMPIGISPTAMHKMAHPKGEIATVRACNDINALMILSMFSTTSLEDVAKQAPICTKWQNIYILKKREITNNLIARAIRYGYRALVVTCDAPVLGNRRHDQRNQFTLGQFTLENIKDSSVQSMREHASDIFDPSITWQDLADLKKSVGDTIRVIAKGIMSPEDAEQALKAGVDGIFVSNHGGRQLDGCPSTIEALPAIVRVVNKRCPVFIDGGFRTGADILKALALGADMVFMGRPPLWALASFGEAGVYRAMQILQEELVKAMMLCGCTKLSDISRNLILERP